MDSLLDNSQENICHIYGIANPEPWSKTLITEVSRPKKGHIARTKENFNYPEGSSVLLLDNDPKPDAVPPIPALTADALAEVLEQCVPGIGSEVAFIGGPSSGAGIITDGITGEVLRVSEGTHLYFAVDQGREIERIGEIIAKRLWLKGHGSIAFARNGAMLVRTLIDTSVWQSNRIDYVCPAHIGDGLTRTDRAPITKRPGRCIVANEIEPLTAAEEAEYLRLVAEAKANANAQGRSDALGEAYRTVKEKELVDAGVEPKVARATVQRACDGESSDLYGEWLLEFAHLNSPISVSEALCRGIELDGEELADPIEGTAYGTTTAMFFFNDGAKPVIHSFAHGEQKYFLHGGELFTGSDDEPEQEPLDGDDERLDFDEDEFDDGSDAELKATVSARNALIRGETPDKAFKRIRRQWAGVDAALIFQKAIEWRKRYASGKTHSVRGVTKVITDQKTLDERFSMLMAPGQPSCIIHIPDSLPISRQDFVLRLQGEIVLVACDKKGNPNFSSAAEVWLGSGVKRTFTRIVFSRKNLSGEYNLFTGFGVQPNAAGRCPLILRHIHEVICSGDAEASEAMLSLIAWQMQNIGKPSRIVVSLYSKEQQIGKGVLLENILLPLFGLHGFIAHDRDSCLGRFKDGLRGKAYLFFDEAAYAKDKALADKLKGFASAKTMAIEGKGVPVITMPSGLNLWLATNHQEVAWVESDDARNWVLKVAPHRRGDHDYFNALGSAIENGELEAFLAMMLQRDVSGFIPQRDVPRNNEMLAAVKAMSRSQKDATVWLEECIEAGLILGMPRGPFDGPSSSGEKWAAWQEDTGYSGTMLKEAYHSWAKGIPAGPYDQLTQTRNLWPLLKDVWFTPHRTNTCRRFILPSLSQCGVALEALINGREVKSV